MRILARAITAFSLVVSSPVAAQAPESYQFDATHAVLEFAVRLVGFNRVRGTFDQYRGDALVIAEDPTRSSVSFSIDVRGIRTGSVERDEHLRSADFFDAAKWPSITFVSERVERVGAGYAAIGPLTIRDVTREVRVPFSVVAPKGVDPFGNTRFAVAGKLTINRHDFGVVGPRFWNGAISDSVEIEFEMPGRRWNYLNMSLGTKERPTAGQLILDAMATKPISVAIADGWRLFETRRADTTMNFRWFEYLKAGGRLSQAEKHREAAAVLELGARISEAAGNARGAANLRAALSEAHLQRSDRGAALAEAQAALRLDSANTTAILLVRHLSTGR